MSACEVASVARRCRSAFVVGIGGVLRRSRWRGGAALASQSSEKLCSVGASASGGPDVGRAGRAPTERFKLFEEHLKSKASRGEIFQKYHFFSSSATEDPSGEGNEPEKTISVTFVDKDGEEHHIKVPIGMSMLEAAHQNDIDLEGACEGSLACSTCHVIVMDMEYYNKLEDPTDEENDMLDLAFGLTETSRLGCQVIATPELDGVRLAIPAATRNFAVDGYVPKPH